MTTITKTQTTTDVTFAPITKIEYPNGTSCRLVHYNHEGWTPSIDLSLHGFTQARAGLDILAKYATGLIQGNAKLFLVAPAEKLGYENGTGRMAYVRFDYQPGRDDFSVNLDGEQVFLTVDAKYIPTRGYRALYLDSKELYAEAWETPIVRDDAKKENLYWRCKAASALLSGYNVSCSAGPQLRARAEAAANVVNSEDKMVAFATYQKVLRDESRFRKDVVEEIRNLEADAKEAGKKSVVAGYSDLDVPLARGGNTNLKRYGIGSLLKLETESGMVIHARIKFGTDAEYLAIADKMRKQNLKLALSQ